MTHLRVWKFRPAPSREAEFRAAYGGDGPWVELFSRSPGFKGLDLLHPSQPGGWWMTLDRWESEAHFEEFQQSHGDQYAVLDRQLEGVAGDEEFVGSFEELD